MKNTALPYVPSLSPLESEEISGWRFATSVGPWGPLLAEYYQAAREPLANEREFWASLIQPGMSVLEIGAGSGFVSEVLAQRNPDHLTLVEPEKEHVRLLKHAMAGWKTSSNIEILTTYFEHARVSPQDLIVFPYDTLPMIIGRDQRLKLFRSAYDRLKSKGLFAVHISTPSWAQKYIEGSRELSLSFYMTSRKNNVSVKRFSKPVSPTEFIKFVSVLCLAKRAKENYVALTSIVTHQEMLEHGTAAGFRLQAHYSDFYGHSGPSADDAIYIFQKENE
jgi:hypothetical protein